MSDTTGLDKRQARRHRRRATPRWQWVYRSRDGRRRCVLSGPMSDGTWEVEESLVGSFGVRLHYRKSRRQALAICHDRQAVATR